MTTESKSFKDRIKEEMGVDYSNSLERNFDVAKKFIRVTNEGNVAVLLKDKLSGKEQILLYLIGKLYSKEAGFSSNPDVENKELMNELGIPKGSLLPWLMDLRKKPGIKQVKKGKNTNHYIPINLVEKALKEVEKKVSLKN